MQQALSGKHLLQVPSGCPARQQALACSHITRTSRKRLRVAAAASTETAAVEDELSDEKKEISKLLNRPYKYGFKTYIESDTFPKGLNEDVVRAISAKKNEPDWMLEFRLKAFRKWLTMEEPDWSDNRYPKIDYQNISYYSEPKMKEKKASLDEVDPELLRTFDKLVSAAQILHASLILHHHHYYHHHLDSSSTSSSCIRWQGRCLIAAAAA